MCHISWHVPYYLSVWPRCKEWSKYGSSRNWAYGKYVLKTKMKWAIMCTFKASSSWRMKKWGASSRWASRRDPMLVACHPHGDHGYVKTCTKRSLSHRSMGEQFGSPHQASVIKKEGPSWDEQDCHHLSQVEYAQGKGMSCERVSNVTISFRVSSNLCMNCIIFLGSCLGLIHVRR